MFGKIATIPRRSEELKSFSPITRPWRSRFFLSLPHCLGRTYTPRFFLSLKDTAKPPTAAELSDYLDFLLDQVFYDLAYYTWLQFLPAGATEELATYSMAASRTFPPGCRSIGHSPGIGSHNSNCGTARPGRRARPLLEFGPGRVDDFGVKQVTRCPRQPINCEEPIRLTSLASVAFFGASRVHPANRH